MKVTVQPNYSQWRVKPSILLRAFDTSTVEGRSKERYRRALLATLASGLSKVTSISMGLISVPLTLRYLGVERYGLWMTLSSFITFLSFSDLGISLGLLNGISKSHAKGDRTLASQYVSSAFLFLTGTATLIGIAFVSAYRWIPWQTLFHLRPGLAVAEAGPAAAVFVFCFLWGIPAGIVTRIQSGYQEGFTANLWAAAGSIIALVALLVVLKLRGSLPLLILAMAGTPILATAVNSVVLFGFQRPWLRPAWSHVKRGISKDLVRVGFLFFFLQLTVALGFSSDNIVLSQILGPYAVTQYSIPAKLFGVSSLGCSLLVAPLWPAYTEALARKDINWVRKTLQRSIFLSLALAVGPSLVLIVFAPKILEMWVGPNIHPSFLLTIGLGTWSTLTALSMPIAAFLNAATVIRFQVVVASAAALLNVGLSIYLTRRIGIPGVIFGSICSQLFCVLIPYYFYTRRFLRSLTAVEV